MILLSKIPKKLSEYCFPFTCDYQLLQFKDQENFADMPIELISTIHEFCFLVMDDIRWRTLLDYKYVEEARILVQEFLSEYQIDLDDIPIFHLSEHRTFVYDDFFKPIDRIPEFIDFLKKVNIYGDTEPV
jgi:hypothetical protein